MNKKVNVFLGLATVVMATVAIFVLFASMFYNKVIDESWGGNEMGSVFQNMFYGYATKDAGTCKPVVILIIAFAAECIAWLGGFAVCLLKGKNAAICFAVNAVLLAFAGFVFLFGKEAYIGTNGAWSMPQLNSDVIIGAGSICSLIFAWIGAILCGYGAYSNAKAA